MLLATHRAEEQIAALTHRLVLKSGRIAEQGRIECRILRPDHARRVPTRLTHLATNNQSCAPDPPAPAHRAAVRSNAASPTLLRVKQADVFLNHRLVLRDINWELRANEHWAIVGPNGAGKSTFLRLLYGDVHPAFGGHLRRFGFTTRNSIWEAKSILAYVSPELQAGCRADVNGAELVASGFFSSIGLLHRRLSIRQRRRVTGVMQRLGLKALATKPVLKMSFGEFRKLLLARALVHRPAVLLFDEPFDGLDPRARASMSRALAATARDGTSLVIVSHHASELPASVTHIARFENGRIVSQGPRVTVVPLMAPPRFSESSPSRKLRARRLRARRLVAHKGK